MLKLECKCLVPSSCCHDHANCQDAPQKVTRLEVIGDRGRIYTKWGCRIALSYQDGGRTLKVFVQGLEDA